MESTEVEIESPKVGSTEVEPTEVDPTEVETTEVEPTEVEPTEVEPTEVRLLYSVWVVDEMGGMLARLRLAVVGTTVR